jgi:hypothetical protein
MKKYQSETQYEISNTKGVVLGHIWVDRGILLGDNKELVSGVRRVQEETVSDLTQDVKGFFAQVPHLMANGYLIFREMKR